MDNDLARDRGFSFAAAEELLAEGSGGGGVWARRGFYALRRWGRTATEAGGRARHVLCAARLARAAVAEVWRPATGRKSATGWHDS